MGGRHGDLYGALTRSREPLQASEGPGVFDELMSEGFINLDEYGYFSLTRKGECLKNLLEKYKERFKRAAPRQVEQVLREKARVGYR